MAVGGGTEVNIDLCFSPVSAPVQAKIDSWRRVGLIGPNEFNKDELARAYEWVKQSIGTRQLAQDEINRNNRVLWDGAQREGLHPELYDLNTYPPGKSPYPVTDKRSSGSQLLMAALEDSRNPLSMIPDAEVLRVLMDQSGGENKAVGVEIRFRAPAQGDGIIADPNGFRANAGDTVRISAKNVILSAWSTRFAGDFDTLKSHQLSNWTRGNPSPVDADHWQIRSGDRCSRRNRGFSLRR